jgi:sugar-specific transcriptional regulator TrmB
MHSAKTLSMQMQDDLLTKLSEFGFTINQAKVYLCIVESGLIPVGKISQLTHLYVQDVYKILPKLEKMGLITKTKDKPVLIKAIPVKKALNHLVAKERRKAKQKIAILENNLEELTSHVMNHQVDPEIQEDDLFIPLTTAEQIRNRLEIAFESTILSCDLVFDEDLLSRLKNILNERFKSIEKIKTRILIETLQEPQNIQELIQEIIPEESSFEAKVLPKSESIPYYIFDSRELWVSMEGKTEAGLPCVLWTNGSNMIRFFQRTFNALWEDPNAILIYPKRQKRKTVKPNSN